MTEHKSEGHGPVFVTTHWSVVLTAANQNTTRAKAALEVLCKSYWHPLYHYVRRRGYKPEDAQDLTQEFFARLLAREAVAEADPNRGRFRSFLLSSLKNFLADEWDKAHARKRGGGQAWLNFDSEETRLALQPAQDPSPDRAFERRWAIALLEQVYARLEKEWQAQGKAAQFAHLRPALAGKGRDAPYAALAQQLGMSEGAVRVTVHRLRQRYRDVLRELIAETVATPAEVEDELRYLLAVLSG